MIENSFKSRAGYNCTLKILIYEIRKYFKNTLKIDQKLTFFFEF